MNIDNITVLKRDGRRKEFTIERIYDAIGKAYKEVYSELTDEQLDDVYDISRNVSNEIIALNQSEIDVETIQDIVVKNIKNIDDVVAKAYQKYRDERAIARANTIDKDVMELLRGCSEYWKNENSNKNSTLVTTQRDYLAGIVSTDISRRKLIPKEVIEAHDKGILHFHDMDYFAQESLSNCELLNLEDMLQNGTVINGVMIEKPHKFTTAMTIATQIITAVTSSTYGGATISLTHLAPFLRDSYNKILNKYKSCSFLTDEQIKYLVDIDYKKEIEDGVQTFNYQINSMSNTNGYYGCL